jgi:glycosyltransferase involved in cell wall biosynthesis
MSSLLFVTTIPGTLSAFFLPLTRHLQAQGWRVDAMAQGISTNTQCVETFDRVWEVEFSRNPLAPQNLLIAPQKIREVLAQREYDIVNVSTPVAAFVTRYALNDLRKQGKPKIVYTAQGFRFYGGGSLLSNTIYLSLEKLAGPWTDYIVLVNREDEEAAKRHRLIPEERVRYIPGTGVNVDRFSADNISDAEVLRVRQEMGLALETPLFLSVAEFIPRKHPQDILRAFVRLGRPEVHLAFAGDGRIFEQMQQLATDLRIQERVHFLGRSKDVPTLIGASVATLLASELEGLPNCVMESFCLEVPVIGTNIRGTRDLLEGGCGLLVKVGDVEGLAQAMAWVLDHPEEAKMMGKRGRERMAAYELKQILKLYDSLYTEVMQEQNFAVSHK